MRSPVPALVAACLGIAAAALVACGDSNGLIAADDADALKSSFDDVAAAVDGQDCAKSAGAVRVAGDRVVALPRDVDRELRAKLEEGVANLEELAARECAGTTQTETTETTETETTPTETTETETTPTETIPTETIPTETQPTQTQTTPTTPEVPPDDETGVAPP